MSNKLIEAAARCGDCAHWKEFRPCMGMCQCPSEAVARGADKVRGWRQTEPSDRCTTGEFALLAQAGEKP